MKEPLSAYSSFSYYLAAIAILVLFPFSPLLLLHVVSIVFVGTASYLYHKRPKRTTSDLDASGIYFAFTTQLGLILGTYNPPTATGNLFLGIVISAGLAILQFRGHLDKSIRSIYLTVSVVMSLGFLGIVQSSVLIPSILFGGYLASVSTFAIGQVYERQKLHHAGDVIHALLWHPLTALLFFYVLHFLYK